MNIKERYIKREGNFFHIEVVSYDDIKIGYYLQNIKERSYCFFDLFGVAKETREAWLGIKWLRKRFKRFKKKYPNKRIRKHKWKCPKELYK